MKTRYAFIVFISGILLCYLTISAVANPSKDIYLLVDNSGSMKKNDPEFLVKKAIIKLVSSLDSSTRLGIYLFDAKPVLITPLTRLNNTVNREKCIRSLDYINYKGAYTGLAVAMEKALYELKHQTDSDSFRSIIFITDGFIDTGDKLKDADNRKWLIESYAEDAKKTGIKIFGIAFTEKADFQLIQSVTTKTDGEYYRALNSSEIGPVFDRILEAIITPKKAVQDEDIPSVIIVNPDDASGINFKMIFIILGGTLVLLVLFFMIVRKFQKINVHGAASDKQKTKSFIPSAILVDLDKISGKDEIVIQDEITTIGRLEENTISLINAAKNVTGLSHAQILFKDNLFYIKDLSTNYTKLNDEKLDKKELYQLKNGDIINIMNYRFQFVLPETFGQTELFTEQGSGVNKTGTTIETGVNDNLPSPHDDQLPGKINSEPVIPDNMPGEQENPSDLKSVTNQSSMMIGSPSDEQPDEEDATLVKPDSCPNHPDRKPTDVCMECYKPFCRECLVETGERLICKDCLSKLSK